MPGSNGPAGLSRACSVPDRDPDVLWAQPRKRRAPTTIRAEGSRGQEARTQVVPKVGQEAVLSPEGAMIVSSSMKPELVDGEPGAWRMLVLTSVATGSTRTLVKQFIRDADVIAHQKLHPAGPRCHIDKAVGWMTDARLHVGPRTALCSPKDDRIALLAAKRCDPEGVWYKDQTEVWACEVRSGELIRLTHDDVM